MSSADSKHTSGEGKIFKFFFFEKPRNYYKFYFLMNLKSLGNYNKSSQ